MSEQVKLDAESIRAALAAVLASHNFASSSRSSAMLKYVVEETLSGRAENIKAYSIAVDALDRPESFNSSTDPVVRVLAVRLRDALALFYAGPEGSNQPIRIEVPVGGYTPTFTEQVQKEPETAPPPSSVEGGPVIARIRNRAAATFLFSKFSFLAIGFIGAIIAGIYASIQFLPIAAATDRIMPQIAFEVSAIGKGAKDHTPFVKLTADHVIARLGQIYEPKSSPENFKIDDGQPAYLGKIILSPLGEKFTAHIQVIDAAQGTVVSVSDIELFLSETEIEVSEFKQEIAAVFALVGPIYQHLFEREDLPNDLACLIGAIHDQLHVSHQSLSEKKKISCLSKVIKNHPDLGIAGVQLATELIARGDQGRKFRGKNAYVAARRVLDDVLGHDPDLTSGLLMMGNVLFNEGSVEAALAFDRRAMGSTPNSPMIVAQYGQHLIRAGSYGEGQAQMEHSIRLSKSPQVWQRTFLYFAMLETKVHENRATQAAIISTQTEGMNGIAAILANVELGDLQKAQRIFDHLEDGKQPSERYLVSVLTAQNFKEIPARRIVGRIVQSPVWPS